MDVCTFYVYIHVFLLFASFFSLFFGKNLKSTTPNGLGRVAPVGRIDARTTVSGRLCPFFCPKQTKSRRTGRPFWFLLELALIVVAELANLSMIKWE